MNFEMAPYSLTCIKTSEGPKHHNRANCDTSTKICINVVFIVVFNNRGGAPPKNSLKPYL